MSALPAPVLRSTRPSALWLTWLHKEWQAQRATLLAYLGLALTCLGAGLWLQPSELGTSERRIVALVLFLGMGVIGVIAFAAPLVVRGEFAAKDDQFLRRIPGALVPASVGKLAFLLLVAVALPVASLLVGEAFLAARGLDLVGLNELDVAALGQRCGDFARAAFLLVCGGVALALTPWVMALATWLPGGRMALGAVAVLGSLLALGVVAVLNASPGLDEPLRDVWLRWLAWLAPLGVVVAYVSLAHGRRGGGAWRSARLGAAVTLVGFLPPGAWLAAWARAYHWPRPDRLAHLRVDGVTPDGRFVMARGAEHASWFGMPMRLDLLSGTAEQVGGLDAVFTNEVLKPWTGLDATPRRFWRAYGSHSVALHVFDAMTGARHAVDANALDFGLDGPVRAELEDDVRASTPFRAPGGRRAWVVGARLHVETESGVDVIPWPHGQRPLRTAGHGIMAWSSDKAPAFFDLTRRACVTPPSEHVRHGVCVGGLWLVREVKGTQWGPCQIFDPDRGALVECPELRGCDVWMLWNDEEVVAVERDTTSEQLRRKDRVFTFRPADRRVTPIDLPASPSLGSCSSGRVCSAYGLRDRRDRLWLGFRADGARSDRRWLVAVDATTRAATVITGGDVEVLAFADADSVLLLEDQRRIVRLDYERKRKTVLFPLDERTDTEAR